MKELLLSLGVIIYFLSRLVVRNGRDRKIFVGYSSHGQIKIAAKLLLATEILTIFVIWFQIFLNPIKIKYHLSDILFPFVQDFGIVVFCLGIALSVVGRFTLCEEWQTARCFSLPRRIIKKGIYSKIRHPIYFGSWLMGLGFEMFLESWLLFPVAIFGFLLVYVLAKIEEKILIVYFGEEYKRNIKSIVGRPGCF